MEIYPLPIWMLTNFGGWPKIGWLKFETATAKMDQFFFITNWNSFEKWIETSQKTNFWPFCIIGNQRGNEIELQ